MEAFQLDNGSVVFAERGEVRRSLKLPCGQCIGCRLDRSRQWAVRCMHEAQMHAESCFITLTYDSDHLPQNGSLIYGHFQCFMKRLRKKLGKVRFYMCGEYGDLTGRPHFHACLFGVSFPDKILYKNLSSGSALYTSKVLSELWPYGFSSVGDVTFESAAYVARYITKKVTGELARDHYRRVDPHSGEVFDLCPEFSHMSLKPGIGAEFYRKFTSDIFPRDFVVSRGVKVKPPKYYYNSLLKEADSFMFDDIAYDRFLKSLNMGVDETPERLADREICTRARLKFKKRGLEY